MGVLAQASARARTLARALPATLQHAALTECLDALLPSSPAAFLRVALTVRSKVVTHLHISGERVLRSASQGAAAGHRRRLSPCGGVRDVVARLLRNSAE